MPQAARVKERSYRGTMKSDLRNLVVAQEVYFSENQTYGGTLGDLGSLYRPSQNVTLTLSGVDATGWSGEAAHALSATTCSVEVAQALARSPTCS